MPKVILDFSEAKDFDKTPVPAGMYKATIDASYAQEIKYGKAKQTPYVSLGYAISEPKEYAGRVVFSNYMLAGPGTGATRGLLRALGLYEDTNGEMFQFNTDTVHGYEVNIKVKLRALPDGTETNDVDLVIPIKG